ncbi:hypothetical protein [Methanococcus maripaludis]|uniref:Putative regulator of Ras-like GTPase activity (Roadblock/LC7/MglB family) n=1 Tax=Methanococcus maripaludis TaxID=39152 RepID=A0A7J9PKF9_METMI|nr:hypothetical protein [Methanococcus maripaludis]MBA2863742.1 putative regulator of Ras-like GTPase activity (Roadblock/LC7/MglB family) [Methanococcus maripaludis]
MENLGLFTISLGAGFFGSYYTLFKLKKDKKNVQNEEKELLELEVIEGLQKLKSQAVSKNPEKASDTYDLLEIALSHDILDITVVNEEGLTIISTLKDPDEVAGQYSGVFQTLNKIMGNVEKTSIKSGEEYIYISTIEKNEMPFYIIANSNIEMDPIDERELQNEVIEILGQYI